MNIAFITRELDGLDRNGGIGTATRYICEHLANTGKYEIHLYHTGCQRIGERALQEGMRKRNIQVHFIHEDADVFHVFERRPYQVYQILRETNHDVYLFHDYLADGFFCLLAQESGVAFRNAHLGVIAHSSSLWCDEGNRRFPDSDDRLSLYDMEQTCGELSEFIVSPSEYLLEWMKNEGWKLPEEALCIPNLVSPPGSFDPFRERIQISADEIRELVFFGRIEERKGALVFCDALNMLPQNVLNDRIVTFLGSECDYTEQAIRALLKPALGNSHFRLNFIHDFDSRKAREYLSRPGCISVMPSRVDNSPCVIYECLETGIPFLASSIGGGKELIHIEDRKRVVFNPDKATLASLLVRILKRDGVPVSRPSYTHDAIVDQWHALFERLAGKINRHLTMIASETSDNPSVSVVLVHHDRPDFLKHSLKSCLEQNYQNLEILVVDDGSATPAALEYLDELEKSPPNFKFRLLRCKNRYLGSARNTGVRHATGEYVIFLDDDNIALPDMVSRFVDAVVFSGADVVSGAMRFFFDQKGSPGKISSTKNQLCVFWGGHSRYSSILINHFGDATGIYKREVLLNTDGFHEIFGVTHEDWKMYADIERTGGKIVTIPDMMFWYRVTEDSMFRSTSRYSNAQMHIASYSVQLPYNLSHLPFVLYAMNEMRKQRSYALRNESPHGDMDVSQPIKVTMPHELYRIVPQELCHPTYLKTAFHFNRIAARHPVVNRVALNLLHLIQRIRAEMLIWIK